MNTELRIDDLIQVPPVQTVIRLEEGHTKSREITASFVFTQDITSHFTVIAESMLSLKGQGYFLKGDFGSGKSHFLAVLYAWLAGRDGSEGLNEKHKGLARAGQAGNRFLPVEISLIRYRGATSLEEILLLAVEKSLLAAGLQEALTPATSVLSCLKKLLPDPDFNKELADLSGIEPEKLNDWVVAEPAAAYQYGLPLIREKGLDAATLYVQDKGTLFNRVMEKVKEAGFSGLFLLIDELSEFLRSKPDAQSLNEDARTLQLLGEMTTAEPLWIIASVQESIEKTGDLSQATYRKIKDRYPVVLALTTVHIRALIAGRLVKHKPGAQDLLYRIYESFRSQFPSFSLPYDDFSKIYPVHPATIDLLEGLSELFSVHRGIVDFIHSRLAGDARRNIEGILERPVLEMLAPDSIYDHFEQHIAEFSPYNVYPRVLVPHFKDVIAKTIDSARDRELGMRLIKMLVLYKIHPTAEIPNVQKLAELAACALFFQDADFNVRFIAEGILERILAASRFMTKKLPPSGNLLEAVYEIVSEADPGSRVDAKLHTILAGLKEDDSRILREPFQTLKESVSWPAQRCLTDGAVRQVNWHLSQRKVFIRFSGLDETAGFEEAAFETAGGKYDLAVLITPDDIHKKAPGGGGRAENLFEFTALLKISVPDEAKATLKEYLALKILAEELNPASPADQPLIQPVKERLLRLLPAVQQAALDALYNGRFMHPVVDISDGVRQLRHFDRLLETVAPVILEKRYPRFGYIAPRRITPSPRLYQRLLDEFILAGSILLREARLQGLSELIEGLAIPLGLAELKSGTYTFAPDIGSHPLLAFFFGLMNAAGRTAFSSIREALLTKEFGLPEDTSAFLVAGLALSGFISLYKNQRVIPVNHINMVAIQSVEELAPGELISKKDRDTLIHECSFLLPAAMQDSFNLVTQREVWKAVIKMKDELAILLSSIQSKLKEVAGFSAFENLNTAAIEKNLNSIGTLSDAIKTSYAAREGLEKFLATWRGSGLAAGDLEYLRKLKRFLFQDMEQLVFINFYINHPEVEKALELEPELAADVTAMRQLIGTPETLISSDEGRQLNQLFNSFRTNYAQAYLEKHTAFYRALELPPLTKQAKRILALLNALSRIESLPLPGGLEPFLKAVASGGSRSCERRVTEELLHQPVCACGYKLDDIPARTSLKETCADLDNLLLQYHAILKQPEIREALEARAFALKDMDSRASAQLKDLGRFLNEEHTTPAGLPDLLDGDTIEQLRKAVTGKVRIQVKNLKELDEKLAGKRLNSDQALAIVREWIGAADAGSILAFEGQQGGGRKEQPATFFWHYLQEPFKESLTAVVPVPADNLARLEEELERQYPLEMLKPRLRQLKSDMLFTFALSERFYRKAVQTAWLILMERALAGEPVSCREPVSSAYAVSAEAKRMTKAFQLVMDLKSLEKAAYPQKLLSRLLLAEIHHHPWASSVIQSLTFRYLAELEREAHTWLALLDPVPVIALRSNITTVILDGVAPDIWLHAAGQIPLLKDNGSSSWFRLERKPETVSALAGLFGLPEQSDPLDAFHARSVEYHQWKGNEEHLAAILAQALASANPHVIRLSLIDETAHHGGTDLKQLALALSQTLTDLLPVLHKACREKNHSLFITCDHGLSWTKDGLSHGCGGVYETAVFCCKLL